MDTAINAESVRNALHAVIDPEIGINIVDLGLIYEVLLSDDECRMQVQMTMTSPACPMGSHLADEVGRTLRRTWPSLKYVAVDVVWDPPWSPDLLSEDARRQLGWEAG